jgi:hypothetical protein
MNPYRSGLIVVLTTCSLASHALAQETKEVQSRLEATFDSKLQTYQSCLMGSAETLLADESKSAESIADESHAACEKSYASASDAALVFTASQVPKSGKLQAVVFSMEQMEKLKANMRAVVLKRVQQKRGQNAP